MSACGPARRSLAATIMRPMFCSGTVVADGERRLEWTDRERADVKVICRVPTAVQAVGEHLYIDHTSGQILIKQIQLL